MIRWQGVAAQVYAIESSDALAGPWRAFPGTVTADGAGVIEFFDAASPRSPRRFYRTVRP